MINIMWSIKKINNNCIKCLKNDQEAVIIYREGNKWKGHVLGADRLIEGSSFKKVAIDTMALAEECGWS